MTETTQVTLEVMGFDEGSNEMSGRSSAGD